MGRLFGHKKYDDILEEIEAQGGWVELEDEELAVSDVEEVYEEELAVPDVEEVYEEELVEDEQPESEGEPEDSLYSMVVDLLEEDAREEQEVVDGATRVIPVAEVKAERARTPWYESIMYDEEEDDDEEDEDFEVEDMDEEYPERKPRRVYVEEEDEDKLGGFLSFKFLHISIAVICICLCGVFGFSVYTGIKEEEALVAANYAQIGTSLKDVEVIGGEGLTALKEAMVAESIAASESAAAESSEYKEIDVVPTVKVSMVMNSVKNDLKIKFTNSSTGKLIANIPFEVTVKSPSGKKSTWIDEDMDGIINRKNIEGGDYTITMVPLTDKKYEKYLMVASNEKATVKEEIVYEKVDVTNEIKKEEEIVVKNEEENVVQTPVESVNEDTVAWVESTKTYVGDSYREISKSDIEKPVVNNVAMRILNSITQRVVMPVTASDAAATILPPTEPTGEPATAEPVTEPTAAPTLEPTTEPTAEPTTEPTVEPTVEPTQTPEATPTAEPTPTLTPSPSSSPTPTLSPSPSPSPTPTLSPSPSPSPTPTPTALLTKSGASVYVKEGDSYRAATSVDYSKEGVKFYIKEEGYKYTGWNTIDGHVYYFDANGNAVKGEQVIRGAKYHFDDVGRLSNGNGVLGIDVSSHNGSVDWIAVKNAGVDYVIIRCGYRGYGSGVLVEDSKYRTNINGALNAGLKVGVYFFSQAIDEIEAVEEASMVLNLVSGYKITFPIFLDVEYSNTAHNGRADGLDVATRTAVTKAFCQTITNGGYRAGVYANKTWLESYLDMSQLSGYKVWLAQYAKNPTYSGHYDMWQYSCTGSIPGLKGNVDLNMSYLGY